MSYSEPRRSVTRSTDGLDADRCDICKFWRVIDCDNIDDYHKDDVNGVCKRYPPTLDTTWSVSENDGVESAGYSYLDYRHWNQPVTEGANWCGEFKAANVQIEGQAASGLSRSNAGLCVF